jgi:hypothetical protein
MNVYHVRNVVQYMQLQRKWPYRGRYCAIFAQRKINFRTKESSPLSFNGNQYVGVRRALSSTPAKTELSDDGPS